MLRPLQAGTLLIPLAGRIDEPLVEVPSSSLFGRSSTNASRELLSHRGRQTGFDPRPGSVWSRTTTAVVVDKDAGPTDGVAMKEVGVRPGFGFFQS